MANELLASQQRDAQPTIGTLTSLGLPIYGRFYRRGYDIGYRQIFYPDGAFRPI